MHVQRRPVRPIVRISAAIWIGLSSIRSLLICAGLSVISIGAVRSRIGRLRSEALPIAAIGISSARLVSRSGWLVAIRSAVRIVIWPLVSAEAMVCTPRVARLRRSECVPAWPSGLHGTAIRSAVPVFLEALPRAIFGPRTLRIERPPTGPARVHGPARSVSVGIHRAESIPRIGRRMGPRKRSGVTLDAGIRASDGMEEVLRRRWSRAKRPWIGAASRWTVARPRWIERHAPADQPRLAES